MKVLHLFNELNFSGAEVMYCNAAPIFISNGCKLVAFSTGKTIGNYAHQFEVVGIKTYHKPIDFYLLSISAFKYYSNLYIFLKEEKIDVLHIHRSNLYFATVIAFIANVKCIKTQHSVFKNRWFSVHLARFKRFISRKILKTVFQSIGKSVYLNELNYYKNPTQKINNWFSDVKFYPAIDEAERLTIRKDLNISDKAFVVIITGACTHNKSHNEIIRAISLVNKKVDCVFLHLGHGDTEKDEIDLAQELAVFEKVHFLGNQVDVRKYLVAADLFIMTSKFEGLGNAALEAMGCGLPLILYNAPGLRDLINNEDNGFLIERNYRLLSDKILYLIENPLIRDMMGENAFKDANSYYSMLNNVLKILSLYKNGKMYQIKN